MSRKPKFTFEQKLKAIQLVLTGKTSAWQLSKHLKCSDVIIGEWIRKFNTFGIEGLKTQNTISKYSKELKLNAVLDYINGKGSFRTICSKYKIRSTHQLRDWVLLYNKGKELKDGGSSLMKIKGIRKNLTLEDRVEIVRFCLENNNNYAEAAIKFQVSYQQVYLWVQKFNKDGIDALIDRRGKRKSADKLSEIDKLKLENKILKVKYRRIELENALLKKLNELEGV